MSLDLGTIYCQDKCKVLFYVLQSFRGDKIKEGKRVVILLIIFALAIFCFIRIREKGRQNLFLPV